MFISKPRSDENMTNTSKTTKFNTLLITSLISAIHVVKCAKPIWEKKKKRDRKTPLIWKHLQKKN